MNLFCLPYAGSSATIYNSWKKLLHESITLHPIELPGRGIRFSEPAQQNINDLVEILLPKIVEKTKRERFSFFGHSLGGLLAYALSSELHTQYGIYPEHIFFSASNPPHVKCDTSFREDMTDQEFTQMIYEMGGTADELITNEQLWKLFFPIIKADFLVINSFEHEKVSEKIMCDFTILAGREDKHVLKDLSEWDYMAGGSYKTILFDGGHFFLKDNAHEITNIINQTIV